MFELLLIRHGQTDWNIERRVMGNKPIPLNTVGRAQARSLAKMLKDIPIDAIYTSPLKRALQTVQIILRGRDSVPVIEEPGLSEINYGDWVGRLFSEIPELDIYFSKPSSVVIPNGEDLISVQKRALAAVDRMRERHAGQRVFGISHADVIKLILVHYLGLPIDSMHGIRIDGGSVSIIHFNDKEEPRLITINCHSEWKRYCGV